MSYITLKNISKSYEKDNEIVNVLDDISFDLEKGEILVITGPSGSGKSTILNLIAKTDEPNSGTILINDKKINNLKGRKLNAYWKNEIGFTFQNNTLIENLNALENVELSSKINKDGIDASEVLKKMGLEKKGNYFIDELSNEEKQKVAISVAIAKKPNILLCDEPTSMMCLKERKKVLNLLKNINKKDKTTIIITTQDKDIQKIGTKTINLNNGHITIKKNSKKSASDKK